MAAPPISPPLLPFLSEVPKALRRTKTTREKSGRTHRWDAWIEPYTPKKLDVALEFLYTVRNRISYGERE